MVTVTSRETTLGKWLGGRWGTKLRALRRPKLEGQAPKDRERGKNNFLLCLYLSCIRIILLCRATVRRDLLILSVFSLL